MYPFHWVPAAGERHASADRRPEGALAYPTGTSVGTLCRERLSADNSEIGWLWPTCDGCNAEVHRLAREVSTGSIERVR